jgi:hypothetical protein
VFLPGVLAALLWGGLLVASTAAQAVPIPDPVPQPLPPIAAPSQSRPAPPPAPPDLPPVAAQQPPPGATSASSVSNGRCSLLLHDGTYLIGVFVETKVVPFEAVFGDIEIPMGKIQVIDLAVVVNGVKTHRVKFVNGDILTGNVRPVPPLKFETRYGMVKVPMEHVARVNCITTAALVAQRPEGESTPGDKPADDQAHSHGPNPFAQPPGPIRPPRAVPVPDDEVE